MLKDIELIYGKEFVTAVMDAMFPNRIAVDVNSFLKRIPKYLEKTTYQVLNITDDWVSIPSKYIYKQGNYLYVPELDRWCLLCESKADIYEYKLFLLRNGVVVAANDPKWTLETISTKYPHIVNIYGSNLLEKSLPYIKRNEESVSLQRIINAICEYTNTSDCPHKTRYLGKVPAFLMKDTQDLDEVINGISKREFFSSGLYVNIESSWRYVVENVLESKSYYEQLVNQSVIRG